MTAEPQINSDEDAIDRLCEWLCGFNIEANRKNFNFRTRPNSRQKNQHYTIEVHGEGEGTYLIFSVTGNVREA